AVPGGLAAYSWPRPVLARLLEVALSVHVCDVGVVPEIRSGLLPCGTLVALERMVIVPLSGAPPSSYPVAQSHRLTAFRTDPAAGGLARGRPDQRGWRGGRQCGVGSATAVRPQAGTEER